jgi:hypothetical protein
MRPTSFYSDPINSFAAQLFAFFLSACAGGGNSSLDWAVLNAREVASKFIITQGFTEYPATLTEDNVNFNEVECGLICNDPLDPQKGVIATKLEELSGLRNGSIGSQPKGYRLIEESADDRGSKEAFWLIYFDALRSDTGVKIGLFRCVLVGRDSAPILLPEFCDSQKMRPFRLGLGSE